MIKTLSSDHLVLECAGDLDIFEAEPLRGEALLALGTPGLTRIEVDLHKVSRFDATAVQVILSLRKSAEAKSIEISFDLGPEASARLNQLGIVL
jgi:anti-anti-sigma regulatory factor